MRSTSGYLEVVGKFAVIVCLFGGNKFRHQQDTNLELSTSSSAQYCRVAKQPGGGAGRALERQHPVQGQRTPKADDLLASRGRPANQTVGQRRPRPPKQLNDAIS